MGEATKEEKEEAINRLWNLADIAILYTSSFYANNRKQSDKAKEHYEFIKKFLEQSLADDDF